MKTLLIASLLCLPVLSNAQPEDDDEGGEVVIEREVREERAGGEGMERREERRERRGERREKRHRGPRGDQGGGPTPEEQKLIKRTMELQKETRNTARVVREGKADKMKDLEKLVGELFDSRIKLAESRLKRHKEMAEKLEKQLASRKEKRDQLIKDRIDELTGEKEQMEW